MNIIEFATMYADRELDDYEVARLEFLDKCRKENRSPVVVSFDHKYREFLTEVCTAYYKYLKEV